MADRGPNPDLWLVTAGPRQSLKGVFYTKSFYPKSFAFGRTSKAQLLAICISDSQSNCCSAVYCSARLRWACYVYSVASNCFVIIVQEYLVTTMFILVKMDSRLENNCETFSFRKQCNYTNLLVRIYERYLSKGRFLVL